MRTLTDEALASRGRTGTTPDGWSKTHNDDVVAMRDELKRHRATMLRLEQWAVELDAKRDQPGDVGHFIAAELRNRIKGDSK